VLDWTLYIIIYMIKLHLKNYPYLLREPYKTDITTGAIVVQSLELSKQVILALTTVL
jgi:hypothetical protein